MLGSDIVVVDRNGKTRSSNEVVGNGSEPRSIAYDPAGDVIFVSITSSGDDEETNSMIALSEEQFEILDRIELEGSSDPDVLHSTSWLEPNKLLQVEINAGTNGLSGNFIGFQEGHFRKAVPSFDAGEGLFLRLLPDSRSVFVVEGIRIRLWNLQSSTMLAESFFENDMWADGQPGVLKDLFVVPTTHRKDCLSHEILLVDHSLKQHGIIPLPAGDYAAVWCEGPAVLAETRTKDKSAFLAWEIL
jgi:hypothetical protein